MAGSTAGPPMDPKRQLALSNYWFVTKCYRALRDLDEPSMSTNEAQDYHIYMSDLDWHADKFPDFEARYCTPFPEEDFERLFREIIDSTPENEPDDDWPISGPGGFQNSYAVMLCLWGWMDCKLRGHKKLGSHGDWIGDGLRDAKDGYFPLDSRLARGRRQVVDKSLYWKLGLVFRALPWPQEPWPEDEEEEKKHVGDNSWHHMLAEEPHLRRAGDKALVHIAGALTGNGMSDNTKLLRSEAMSALSLMRDQMRQSRNWDFAIFPVFLYSFCGLDVRVLQFHFDPRERKIMVRKTPYMRIDNMGQHDKIKLMLRWMINKPIGNTELDLSAIGPMDESYTSDPQLSPTPRKNRVKCA